MRKKGGHRSIPGGIEDRDPAQLSAALLTDARLYLKAAKVLATEEIWSPEYFLLCHAIELILKSYLASHGATEKELKQLGHRLLRTYSRALKQGFCPTDVRTTEVIRWLSPFHEALFFRYRKGSGFVQYPATSELVDVVSALIRQIDPIVRSRFRASQAKR